MKDRIAAFKDAGVTHLQVHPIPLGDQTNASLIEVSKGARFLIRCRTSSVELRSTCSGC